MAGAKPAEGKIEEAPTEQTEQREEMEEIGYRVVALSFTADFEYKESASSTRVYPKGWSGEIPEDRAQEALDQRKAELR